MAHISIYYHTKFLTTASPMSPNRMIIMTSYLAGLGWGTYLLAVGTHLHTIPNSAQKPPQCRRHKVGIIGIPACGCAERESFCTYVSNAIRKSQDYQWTSGLAGMGWDVIVYGPQYLASTHHVSSKSTIKPLIPLDSLHVLPSQIPTKTLSHQYKKHKFALIGIPAFFCPGCSWRGWKLSCTLKALVYHIHGYYIWHVNRVPALDSSHLFLSSPTIIYPHTSYHIARNRAVVSI